MFFSMRYIALALLLTSCSSNPPAPVIDRLPSNNAVTSKPSASKSAAQAKSLANRPTYKAGDWRPDTYTVKKGDTLFSIGLEYGYYYKDIAQANNIEAPYPIKVGQTLKFSALKDKTEDAAPKAAQTNSDGVTTYPLGAEPTFTSSATPKAATPIAISEPKGMREPYSDEAFKTPLPAIKPVASTAVTAVAVATKTAAASSKHATDVKPETKPEAKTEPKPEVKADTKPEAKTNVESPEDMDWAWPTKGKVTAGFNESSNKGIDIAGSTGQPVQASAAGKVIYSGSDLRGSLAGLL